MSEPSASSGIDLHARQVRKFRMQDQFFHYSTQLFALVVLAALVGGGPQAGAVDAGARRLGLDGAVIRPGAVPHAEVADWMAACDVLALVSRVEPLGVVALEAMAAGRPVVATREGGTAEVVPDPAAGRIVDPLDPVAVSAALLAVLDAPPSPEACRAAAEPHALHHQAARDTTAPEDAVARVQAGGDSA